MKNQKLCELILDNYASLTNAELEKIKKSINCQDEEAIMQILAEFAGQWVNAPCDPEGATKEQDEYLDTILENCAEDLLKLK